MNYLGKIMEILQRATAEEAFMVLRFAKNVVVGKKEEGDCHGAERLAMTEKGGM